MKESPLSSLSKLAEVALGSSTTQQHRGRIEGEVRNLQERQETDNSQKTWTVWSFRVESFDKAGNRLQPVPVEMRGRAFQGMLNEGDQIRIATSWKAGQTVRVKEVYNVTTRSKVKAKGIGVPGWVWNILWLLALSLAAAYVCGGLGAD